MDCSLPSETHWCTRIREPDGSKIHAVIYESDLIHGLGSEYRSDWSERQMGIMGEFREVAIISSPGALDPPVKISNS